MDKRPNISHKYKKKKPSKIFMSFAFVIAVYLPYFLVTHFSQHKKNPYTKQSISLPELSEEIQPEIQPEVQVEVKPEIKHNTESKPKHAIAAPTQDNQWQTIIPRRGDSMAIIFNRLGLSAQNLHAVLDKNPHAKALTSIKLNQKIQFLISKKKLEKLVIPVDTIQTLTVYRQGDRYKTRIDSKKLISHDLYVTGTVKGSLFSTAQRLKIPSHLIRQMTQVLNKQLDFSRSIRAGDQFSIVYNAYYVEDKLVKIGDIVAVSYTNKGKTYQAIKHTHRNGDTDYYTPTGTSLKKAFSRYPIKFSHISSTFAVSRYHPILHYKRAHKGIDLAAPIGTPIQAVGDGVITVIDRHNGYGNMIKIKHDRTFSTVYGHMLKFQKGLYRGSRVKRGQVIGYVGQTGLATGPHCHYELHVNDQPRNPTTISLPTAAPVPSREMASFRAKSRTLFARLKLYEEANLASKGKRNHVG